MENLITGAEALMRSLEHQGVKTIFGYPGGSIMPHKALHVCRARSAYVWSRAVRVQQIPLQVLRMP